MKVYILSDMEGTAGVTIWDQVLHEGPKFDQARRLMTLEINAAAAGAFDAGASLVLVNDAHLQEHNLDLEVLDPRIEYLMGFGKHSWAELDSSFDVLLQVGAHAKAGTTAACLRHTWTPSSWVDIRINGVSVGEIGLIAAGAGALGVPSGLITGDDKACAEASKLLPGITQVQVKKGLTWQAARCISPVAACELIRMRASEACRNADALTSWAPAGAGFKVEIITTADDRGELFASRSEAEELWSVPLSVQRVKALSLPEAFLSAAVAKPESYVNLK